MNTAISHQCTDCDICTSCFTSCFTSCMTCHGHAPGCSYAQTQYNTAVWPNTVGPTITVGSAVAGNSVILVDPNNTTTANSITIGNFVSPTGIVSGGWDFSTQNYLRIESCGRVILEMTNDGELFWEDRKIDCDETLVKCLKDVLRGMWDERVIREVLDS